jgi:hypothetical protein
MYMPSDELDDQISAAVEAIVFGVYDSGALYDPNRWWPRSYLPYSPLFAVDLHSRWVGQWREIPRNPTPRYARATAIWVLLAMASRSLKAMFEAPERCQLFHDLFDDMGAVTAGDIFCRDGSHQVLEPSQAQAIVDDVAFQQVDDKAVDRAYAVLNAALLAYSEAVFFSANCTVRDIHGPYPVRYQDKSAQLLVRDYYKLRDVALEPESEALGLEAVTAYSIYNETVGFTFSTLNDYSSDQSLAGSVIAHAAELKSGDAAHFAMELSEIREVTKSLNDVVAAVSAKMRAADATSETLEIVRRTYYRASPIAHAAKGSWEPDPAFVAELTEKLATFEPAMPAVMTRSEFAQMVDPRI